MAEHPIERIDNCADVTYQAINDDGVRIFLRGNEVGSFNALTSGQRALLKTDLLRKYPDCHAALRINLIDG